MVLKSTELPEISIAPMYQTSLGRAYVGDSLELLRQLPSESIDLVMTSPPFALLRQKEYGNEDQYSDVPEFLFKGLVLARSKGSFFNSRIADRYPHRQIG